MAESNTFTQVPDNSTGNKMDEAGLSVGGEAVHRQRVQAGATSVVSATFTRPSNTTPYTANDAVANSVSAPVVMTFEDAGREGMQSGVILAATLIDSANKATKGEFELWLFDTAPAADNDADPFTPSDAELLTLVGVVDFGNVPYVGDAQADASGNAVYVATGLSIPFKCPTDAVLDLYGKLVVRNAYTPVSGEIFAVRLHILQD